MQRDTSNNDDFLNISSCSNKDVLRGVPNYYHNEQKSDFFFLEDDVERSVAHEDEDEKISLSYRPSGNYGKLQANVSTNQDVEQLKVLDQQEAGICWLPLVDDSIQNILQSLTFFFTDRKIGFSNPTPAEFVGYFFKEATYAFFNLMVYIRKEDGLPGLRIRRLNGDAFLTTEMFIALRDKLISEDLVFTENDPWNISESDGEDLFSDDEENDLENFEENEVENEDYILLNELPTSTYLQLGNDTGLIDYWMYDILECEYLDQRLHTLMMMAHNSENSENLDIMLNHSEEKIFESIMKVMEEDSKSLPMIRSCVRTLHNIISGSENINISWNMVKVMCECLLTWSQSQETRKFSYHRPVSNSIEIQTDLASSLSQLVQKMNGEAPLEIKQSIEEVQIWLENETSAGLCHPEARENLEVFVQNFTPIACC